MTSHFSEGENMKFESFEDKHSPVATSLVNLGLEQVPDLKGLATHMPNLSHLTHLPALEIGEAAAAGLAVFSMPGALGMAAAAAAAAVEVPKLVHCLKEKLANTDSSENEHPSALARLTVARAQNYYSHPNR
jgi:hypothetical protein